MPRTRNGGPPAGTAAATSNYDATNVNAQRNALDRIPAVASTLLRAAAGAQFDRLLVRVCPWCQHAHVHFVSPGEDTAVVRSPRCAPHRSYAVEVSGVLPATSPVAGHRRRAGLGPA